MKLHGPPAPGDGSSPHDPTEDRDPRWFVEPGPIPQQGLPVEVRVHRRGAPEQVTKPRWMLAIGLFLATLLTTTTMGAVWVLLTSTRRMTDLELILGPRTAVAVWSDPELIRLGLSFSLPALFILLCHELGHYLACRHYRLPATLPYFLPLPLAIGTLGAFIRIRAPIRTKRQLFDVGVAGPLAGFVALIPFLILGVLWSEPVTGANVPHGMIASLLVPGNSVALSGLSWLIHGPLGEGQLLQLHPFALAAWFGLLATSFNLIPLGQLDGGHILYATLGKVQRQIALPIWLTLLVTALFLWLGWLLWCVITLVMGLHHPPVYDEEEPLDRTRRLLAWAALAVFLLSFMPVPLGEILVRPIG